MMFTKAQRDRLEQLDRLLMSDDPSVRDLVDQALVMQSLIQPDPKELVPSDGVFVQMLNTIVSLEAKLRELELEMITKRNPPSRPIGNPGYINTTNTPWQPTVTLPGTGGWNPGSQWQGTASAGDINKYGYDNLGMLTVEQIQALSQSMSSQAKTATPAAADDEDAINLFDPDTGSSMLVKLK
jgi:hypothetical protein